MEALPDTSLRSLGARMNLIWLYVTPILMVSHRSNSAAFSADEWGGMELRSETELGIFGGSAPPLLKG